jgi:hypothetical protein
MWVDKKTKQFKYSQRPVIFSIPQIHDLVAAINKLYEIQTGEALFPMEDFI